MDLPKETCDSIEVEAHKRSNEEEEWMAEYREQETATILREELRNFFQEQHDESGGFEEAIVRSYKDQGGVDGAAMIQQGIKLVKERFQINLEPNKRSVEPDGDCVWKAFLLGLGEDVDKENIVQEARTEVAQYGLNQYRNHQMDTSFIQGMDFETELASLKRLGDWAGPVGDFVPQLLSSSRGVPIVLLDLETESIQYILPENVFNGTPTNTPPVVIVRNKDHYEALDIPESQAPRIEMLINRERQTRQECERQKKAREENTIDDRETSDISFR